MEKICKDKLKSECLEAQHTYGKHWPRNECGRICDSHGEGYQLWLTGFQRMTEYTEMKMISKSLYDCFYFDYLLLCNK